MNTDCKHCGKKQVWADTLGDSLAQICNECRKEGHFGYVRPCKKCKEKSEIKSKGNHLPQPF